MVAPGPGYQEQLDEIINIWCQEYEILRNQTQLMKDGDTWLIEDEFSLKDPGRDVFPKYYSSFQEYMRAHGLSVLEKSYGCYRISILEA